jgi:DNA polymerase V
VVAASAEAKALGLTRGLPFFLARPLIRQHHVVVHSSNYALYQDASDRIFALVSNYAERREDVPQIERYSIDECFFSVSHIEQSDLLAYGRMIRERILQVTGIPLRIAFGPTKQLAKVAATLIKAHPESEEVSSLLGLPPHELDALLAQVPVTELWGIGRKQAAHLHEHGITTASALKDAESRTIRRLLTVTGARIQWELRGLACIPLQVTTPTRQSILYSRGFARPVELLFEMREAVATYTARAARKLRDEHLMASEISVFIMTNPYERQAPQYSRSTSQRLPFPTSFTPELVCVALSLLEQSYREGFRYKRAGVSLSSLISEEIRQPDLFGAYNAVQEARHARMMVVIDIMNEQWSREVLFLGAQGLNREWEQHPRWLSPRASTRWNELITVT